MRFFGTRYFAALYFVTRFFHGAGVPTNVDLGYRASGKPLHFSAQQR